MSIQWNRASMRCIGTQVIPMAIGVATQPMAVLAAATHVLCCPAGGENSQSLWMQVAVSGSGQPAALPVGASDNRAGFINVPVPIPVHSSITSYSLRRNVTTAAIDYVVFYFSMA